MEIWDLLPLVSQGSSTYAKLFPLPDFWGNWCIFFPTENIYWTLILGWKYSLIPTPPPAFALLFLSSKNIPMQHLKAAILLWTHYNSPILPSQDTDTPDFYPYSSLRLWALNQLWALLQPLSPPELAPLLKPYSFITQLRILPHLSLPYFHEGMNFCFSPRI